LFFAVPSFLLAAVTPFVIKLLSSDKTGIGSIAGKVSAFSTVGSIAGTFLGGFILVSFFSVTVILLLIALVLCAAAVIVFSANVKTAAVLGVIVLGVFAGLYYVQKTQMPDWAIETMYNSLFIAEHDEDGRKIRTLYTDSEKLQGRMYVDNPTEMAADYLRFIADAFINGRTKSVLMLGGGIYVFPRWLAAERPDINIDIVEIDPGITKAARDFFHLRDRRGQRIIHEDARYFVNRLARENSGGYDIVFQDAYGSPLNVPFQLATVEHFSNVKTILSENGVFLVNFIGSLDSAMFAGLNAAVREAFPSVKVFAVNEPDSVKAVQNIILAAWKTGAGEGNFTEPEHLGIAAHRAAAFRDGFAPVERYTMDMVK
jgi:spermidine synthase